MKFNYNELWKLLIDKNMIKKDLMEKTEISLSTVAKMIKGEPVNMQILWKICTELGSDIGELVCIDKSCEEDK